MPNALPGKDLLPRSPLLRLTDIQHDGPKWIVRADGPPYAACPTCGRVSTSRHSAYVRTMNDLPAVGAVVALKIRVSRWRCRSPACAVRLFADRLPGVADLRGRRTCRANVVARLIGYALGGRAGERLTTRIGLPVSNDTLLRGVKQGATPTTAARQAQVIGVDEWAKRKGRTYGTILVDLERHTVIDVLDDHSTEAVEQWLVAHPHDLSGPQRPLRALALHRAYLPVRMTAYSSPTDRQTGPLVDCRFVRPSRAKGHCRRPGAWPPRRKLAGNAVNRRGKADVRHVMDLARHLNGHEVKVLGVYAQVLADHDVMVTVEVVDKLLSHLGVGFDADQSGSIPLDVEAGQRTGLAEFDIHREEVKAGECPRAPADHST